MVGRSVQLCLFALTLIASLSGCAVFDQVPLATSVFAKPSRDVVKVDRARFTVLAKKANKEGLHWLDYGDPSLALHAFEKAIRLDETFSPAHNNIGQMHFAAGDMHAAAAAFDRAIQLEPGNPVPHNNLGLALEYGGKPEEAIGEYQIAYELDPSNEEFLGNLIRVRMKLDPWDQSIVGHLKELEFIETRPIWREWLEEQIAIRNNPFLDRGPADPDLSDLDQLSGDSPEASAGELNVIEEVDWSGASQATPADSLSSPKSDSAAEDEQTGIEPSLPPIPLPSRAGDIDLPSPSGSATSRDSAMPEPSEPPDFFLPKPIGQ